MKIIVDSIKEINRAWQCVVYGKSEEPKLLEDADNLLMSILKRADKEENNVERILDDIELKYLRLLVNGKIDFHAIQAIQTIRERLGVKSTINETIINNNLNYTLSVDLPFIVGSLLEILTNNSSCKHEELMALKLILAGVKNENNLG